MGIMTALDTRKPASDLLERMMAVAVKDKPTVTTKGKVLGRLTDGVTVRPLPTHADVRGSVMELIDDRWGYPDPIGSAYVCTIRPGVVKGWSIHLGHQDRYALIAGEMEVVLFDPRPDSPTFNEVCRIVMSDQHRCLVNIPINIWHADHNIGTEDVIFLNFPTEPYNYEDSDKYRLPIDTDLIPHSFGSKATGW